MSEFQKPDSPTGTSPLEESSELDTRESESLVGEVYTPTWDPTSEFCFPVAEIPVVNHIPCDLNWDHFTEINHFADGSNSNVFTALMAGQTVVIKMIKETAQENETATKEFDHEHGILARIQHKNIIKVLGAGFIPRRFIVLEFLAGGSLNTLLQDTAEKQIGLPMKIFFKPTFTYANLLQKAYEMAEAFHHLQNSVHKHATVIHRGGT
jgi:serine/threonine protein kinase